MSSNNNPVKEATIIGGGIIGVQCGIDLLKEGFSVTLIERDEIGAGASQGNAGVLGSGTCVPMSDPTIPMQIPKWLFDPLGPMSVQWKHLPSIAPWIIRFLLAGRMSQVKKISVALRELHKPTIDMYRALLQEAGNGELVKQNGYLHVYSGKPFKSPPLGAVLRQACGVDIDFVDQKKVRELEPALSTRYTHGFIVNNEGFTTNPHRLVRVLGQYYQKLGGHIIKGDVKEFEFENGNPVTILTNGGRIPVKGDLIVATGVWSPEIAKCFSFNTAIEAERGYNVTLPNPGLSVSRIIMIADRKVLITPTEEGLRFAGTTEFANLHAQPNFERARKLLHVGKEVFSQLNTTDYTQWIGARPTTPDSLPLIGRLSQFNSVIFACGHGHTGLAGAPMTAKIVTALATNKSTPINTEPFDPNRFK
jgi:D-amino-acid dehydrogenase